MNRKKAKDNIPQQAALENIPEEDMVLMVNAFWKEVLDGLEKVKYIRINIGGLGTINTRYGRLKEAIKTQQAYISRNSTKLAHAPGQNKLLKELDKLDNLKKMVSEWEKEYQLRAEKGKKKQEYKDSKK